MTAVDETVTRYREAKSEYDRATTRCTLIGEVYGDVKTKRDRCWRELVIAIESLSDAGREQVVEEQFGER